jgi:type 1 fimbriae regulatory protein FimB/type 1 fimbriae regulatory protein FimE
MAYRHGLRASELVGLRWDDLDLARLHVRRSKGGEAAVHPIGGKEMRALRRQGYLGHRSIMSTQRYTALAPDRFKRFWKD